MQTFRKYQFNTLQELETAKEQMESIGAFAVYLGNIILIPGEYDEEGNEIKSPVISDKFHLDCLYKEESLSEYVDNEVWCENIGVHTFLGCDNLYIEAYNNHMNSQIINEEVNPQTINDGF